ncbi:MAG TPA: hypothetical protein VFO19_21285, partial [Vicinamibacterales bacterium]|nr:hypothetical protein [Vicinamibacterales bacterium]
MAQATAALKGGPAQLGKLAGLVIELAAILLVIYYFQLESQGFFHVALLASAGFVVHYFLPFEHRLPFFLLLSLAAVAVIFGWQALWLIGIGLLLIGVCHLPLSLGTRIGVLTA